MNIPGNITRRLFIVTLALIGSSSMAFGQTTSNRWASNGPYGGVIRWFTIAPSNPSLIYARADRGVSYNWADPQHIFKSADGGATWALADSEMPGTNVGSMVFNPTDA